MSARGGKSRQERSLCREDKAKLGSTKEKEQDVNQRSDKRKTGTGGRQDPVVNKPR